MFRCSLLCLLLGISSLAAQSLSDAIRNNDLATIKLAKPAEVNVPGRLGLTPLMQAATFGSLDAIQILLDLGADPNATDPRGATPLIYAAWDLPRTRLLVSKGANINAASKAGRTPLLVAAASPTAASSAHFLIEKGADPKARDQGGFNLLMAAAAADSKFIEPLLNHGLDLKTAATRGGFTPLHVAAGMGNLATVKLLLAKGADPNAATTFGGRVKHGDIALNGLTPLMLASPHGSPELIATLISAGADVNARDIRGMTPIMFALSTENQNTAAAKVLLAKGAKLDVKTGAGETVTDWAHKFNRPATLSFLGKAPSGATEKINPGTPSPAPTVDAANSRALELLERSSTEFFKQGGCGGCHHPLATLMALGAARGRNQVPASEILRSVAASTAPAAPSLLQLIDPPGAVDTIMFTLTAMAAVKHPADLTTDALVHYLATSQLPDGSWDQGGAGISRAPIEESGAGRAAFAIRSLAAYPLPARQAEFTDRIGRARAYLLKIQPKTAYEAAEKLLGLQWSGAPHSDLASTEKLLRKMQHPDGGFSQNPNLPSDAYATGIALWALSEAGVPSTSKPYQQGIKFLTQTQRADGSWYVASRSPKFQPYFESGFPYGHDQWISAHATAYASIALSRAAK